MNEKLPKPVHASYLKHRKDTAWKIIFPVVLSSVLCVGLIVLINIATFRGGGDVQRWADISTMWIAIPVMIMLLVFLALFTMKTVWPIFQAPKPAVRPADYPESSWPLWFSALAFYHNRAFGLLFLAGLVLALFIH